MMPDPQEGGRSGGADTAKGTEVTPGDLESRLTIGTWNLSGWSAAKARTVLAEVGGNVLAVQETHLAVLPLQWAHRLWTVIFCMAILCDQSPVAPTGKRVVLALCYGRGWR